MKDKLPASIIAHRELAYRRALKAAGYLPQSIEVMVKRDKQWIKTGR